MNANADDEGWTTVRTVGYTGQYDYGDDYDRRACGGVVLIQERTVDGKRERRAYTSNGRFGFATPLEADLEEN